MITLHPTKDEGATSHPSPLLYVDPDAMAVDPVIEDLGEVNVGFLVDVLSAKLTHARCGCHLYRSVAGRSANPVMKAKFQTYGKEVEADVEALEGAVTSLGGNPCYVSAPARAVEAMDSNLLESTFMLNGSIDPMTAEMAMLDAVLVAESLTSAQNATLASFVDRLPDGPSRDVLADLVEAGAAQQRRLEWAQRTKVDVATAELSSTTFERVGQTVDQLVARVHNWLA